jgi:hypothetical protein
MPIADLISQLEFGNWKSAMLLVSSVGQHRHDPIVIGLGDERIDIQMTLSLVGLLRQYVPRMRVAPLDLPGSRQPHTLRCTFVGFKFWHN